MNDYLKQDFDLPAFNAVPKTQTRYEKKMAKLMERIINWQYTQIRNSKMIKTPFGTITWTPK